MMFAISVVNQGAAETLRRKLTAIMFTDIFGYSRLIMGDVMGNVGSKACYVFWGAERFCHVPVAPRVKKVPDTFWELSA